ncbi:TRAP transporter small permease subunit [Providencia rettgeri]|nr:TRAP transporter small permease subunit [Providencia rettgeri]
MAIIALSIFGYLGYELSIIAEDKITPIIGVSYYYIDLSVPIGASIMVLFSIQHLLEDMSKLIKEINHVSNYRLYCINILLFN